jgi:hypothetical protein
MVLGEQPLRRLAEVLEQALVAGIANEAICRYRVHPGRGLMCAAGDPRRLVEQPNRL